MKLATRCLLFVLLVSVHLWPETPSSCAAQIFVGDRKSVTVRFPCMDRNTVVDLVSGMFAKGDEAAKKRFAEVLAQSGEITLMLTTRR